MLLRHNLAQSTTQEYMTYLIHHCRLEPHVYFCHLTFCLKINDLLQELIIHPHLLKKEAEELKKSLEVPKG